MPAQHFLFQKNGSVRLVVDYKILNKVTVLEASLSRCLE